MYINNIKFSPQRFSSGELKLKNDYLDKFIIDNKINILYENDTISYLELFAIINYFTNKNVNVGLTLGYLPYQRMNHPEGIEVETVKYVAQTFNSLNLAELNICEPHCSLDYFKNANYIPLVEKIYNKVKPEINFDENKDLIVFTDKGSMEKFSHLGKNHLYAKKVRDKHTGLVASYELSGNIEKGQKIIIIDDIISSGDTIMEAITKVNEKTKTEVYIVCGHYENNKYNHRLLTNEKIAKIFASNSLKKRGNNKLKLFSLKELIYD